MTRLALGTLVAALAVGLGTAAPVPKDASKPDPTPELKAVFDTTTKAVKAAKWPGADDEKVLRGTAEKVFERMLKAADQKPRALPVAFDKLTKMDVAGNYAGGRLDGNWLIAGDVWVTSAKNSVIFASGNVQITSAQNCVIVAQNVRVTGVQNCTIIAGEYIRITSARKRDGEEGSVLVAGQWIGTTGMDATICHVLRPTGLPNPDEGRFPGNGPHPAIRTNGADNVIFLNAREETGANGPKNCTYLPQKAPIAK